MKTSARKKKEDTDEGIVKFSHVIPHQDFQKLRAERYRKKPKPIQLNVKLTGDMAEVWETLLKQMEGESASSLLKEAIRIRALITELHIAGEDVYANIDGEREKLTEFLGLARPKRHTLSTA
jgi:hypothetical protein